ncbi:MFS transporter [Pseudonocardiaceae bacterium YIM PH 21723]|nr:MFS transporter [Pseudonocardiaceae bacterium YIM PH 21723]
MSTSTSAHGGPQPAGTHSDSGFFGQPRALSTLFFTEMWERFSYYGMRAVLALYLYTAIDKGGLGWDKPLALMFVGIYGSAIYMSGVLGGWLADRVTGPQKTTQYGALLIMFGHIALATPFADVSLYIGIFFLVIGTGLLKPTINSLVGSLYSPEDTRRDAGFTIFYMSVNIGAFVGQILTAWLAASPSYGYHWAFGAAAIGMALGLAQYMLGRNRIGVHTAVAPNPLSPEERSKVGGRLGIIAFIAVLVLGAMYAAGVLDAAGVGWLITIMSVILPTLYFVTMLRSPQVTAVERSRLFAYMPLFVAIALFFMLFEQQSTVLVAFADTKLDRLIGGWEMPPALFQALNPLYIVIMAPILAILWTRLGTRQPTTPIKFSLALWLIGLAYVITSVGVLLSGDKVNVLWLAAMLLVMTAGELLLSPVGLSVTTKLAPEAFKAQTVALFFLAIALGQGVGAQLTVFYTEGNEANYFFGLAAAALVLGVIVYSIKGRVSEAMRGVH